MRKIVGKIGHFIINGLFYRYYLPINQQSNKIMVTEGTFQKAFAIDKENSVFDLHLVVNGFCWGFDQATVKPGDIIQGHLPKLCPKINQ